jgi:NNP family nitrate/nitrite transporter-like MFS transporter
MDIQNKATGINLFDFKSVQMRTFHLTWFAFFLCFFGWFGIAPLMAVVREDLLLTKAQIGNTIIASVGITVLVRLLIGPLTDKLGPRRVYTGLLVLGSIPVMTIGLANSYETFLLARLAIGAIGASFVITQYHTSMMFAPNVVGTANATTAGWGNLGGGVTQMVMPLFFAGILALGFSEAVSWRMAMVIPGVMMLITAFLYWTFTTDAPDGDFKDIRKNNGTEKKEGQALESFKAAASDYRVWLLFIVYAACFGVELTLNNIAAIYYFDNFDLSLKTAGIIAGLFGLMNLFARTLGGVFSDFMARKVGFQGRIFFLFAVVLCEGLALMLFSQQSVLVLAVGSMLVFSLFVQMTEGATYGIVPFVNKKALGAVAGIVGAGGNVGAVAAGFLFKAEGISYSQGFFYIGCVVACVSVLVLLVRFSPEDIKEQDAALAEALAQREAARNAAEQAA